MIPNIHLAKVNGITESAPRKQDTSSTPVQPATNFRDILGSRLETPVQFSKHAALRLNDRNINLSGEQINRVADGIGKANEKGIRDSLVIVDDVALVVNVKSRTVITAISQTQENIFSNIDGAVIV
ncbi:MAG: flagellar protein [Defluviitaleaceae bacterium]|nr:flagellar protein [Defluviitaleaceae bacterium]